MNNSEVILKLYRNNRRTTTLTFVIVTHLLSHAFTSSALTIVVKDDNYIRFLSCPLTFNITAGVGFSK